MIDYVWLYNNDYNLSTADLGEPYLVLKRDNGTHDFKYRLFKTAEEIVYLDEGEEGEEEGMSVKERPKNDPYLSLLVNEIKGFTLQGSLRRWYYGDRSWSKDFNYTDFLKCIKLLSKRAAIPEKVLLQSFVVRVEIGGNVILPASYRDIQTCIVSFPKREKGWRNNTVYFNSTYSVITFYDKLNSLKKEGLMHKKTIDGLLKKIYVLRFELNLRRAKKTTFKNEVKTLSSIIDNWGYLLEEWNRHFENVKFENKLPPKLPKDKEWLNLTLIQEFFIAYGIHHFGGLEAARKIVRQRIPKNNRPRENGKLARIVASFEPIDFEGYINNLKKAVEAKKDEMKTGLP